MSDEPKDDGPVTIAVGDFDAMTLVEQAERNELVAELAGHVHVEAEETLPPLFRCYKGHEQRGSGETVATLRNGVQVSTGNLCVACQLEWFGKKFPTRAVKEKEAKTS